MQRVASIIAIALISTTVCTSGFGARKYGMSGCGLGSFVIDPDSGGIGHVFGYSTNNMFFNTTIFGITSGTSNCEPDEDDKKAMNQEQFVTHNLASLAKEISQGEGETLVAFTEILGCSAEISPAVRQTLKSNAGAILAAPGAIAILETAKDKLRSVPAIGQHCQFIS